MSYEFQQLMQGILFWVYKFTSTNLAEQSVYTVYLNNCYILEIFIFMKIK